MLPVLPVLDLKAMPRRAVMSKTATSTPRFSCVNLANFSRKVPDNWTRVNSTLDKISSNICNDGRIVSRKKVVLDERECGNTIPVLNNWWKGYGLDRDGVPRNFVDAILKKTTCKV